MSLSKRSFEPVSWTTSNQDNPFAKRILNSGKVYLISHCTDGEHPDVVALREKLQLHGSDLLPLTGRYQVFNFWCHGHYPGTKIHSQTWDKIEGVDGNLPDYVYIVEFSPHDCIKNKARIDEYSQLVKLYYGIQPDQGADRSGRVEYVSPYASFEITNLHHFIRLLGYKVIRAKSGFYYYEPREGQGIRTTVYECNFAVNREGLNASQLPNYAQEGDTLGRVILEYGQDEGVGQSIITGTSVIITAPTSAHKFADVARYIIKNFSPETLIYTLAENYLLRENRWRPQELSVNYVSTAAHDPNDHSAAQERHAEPEHEHGHGSAHITRADEDRGDTEENPIIITTGAGPSTDIPSFPPSPTYSATPPASPPPQTPPSQTPPSQTPPPPTFSPPRFGTCWERGDYFDQEVDDLPRAASSHVYYTQSEQDSDNELSSSSGLTDDEVDDSSFKNQPAGGKNDRDWEEYLHQNKRSRHDK